ncbi:MAG: 16S rRNA (uracil(1498)-N(3))-methyltransferase [Spirochaetes bacterium]|nr:RsmE family RNA methyltransferase [Spirochaetota bacterium]NMB64630.1 16S rRNA (uracil(1498)-N(3))-methyltransferase [Spirochaetota bacterium]HOJ29969.1 RsmE family RNA methyltransferase [Spirochaetota bacterium]HOM10783.1 RsmE family RNA methyltransferase [Spirochaetota bacterium]HPP50668.1 RsmE family RNA methyltransferase [Spirochaetota bacterium]
MAQFFVSAPGHDNTVVIEGKDYYHLVRVRRVRVGDSIDVIDTEGVRYRATIAHIEAQKIIATIMQTITYPEISLNLTLCVALLKGKKFDLVIQKAVEIGVRSIIPVVTERTIPDISEKEEKKLERWQKIATEAAKQCLRKDVPRVSSVMEYTDVLQLSKGVGILAHADPEAQNLRQYLKDNPQHNDVMLLTGPEGGFSKKEVEIARQFGWIVLYNGATQLRAETAAIVLPAIIIYEWGYT